MATPVATGAAALVLQANPKLTPNMVKAILMYTAQPLARFNMLEQGAGEVNLEGAARVAKLVRTDLSRNMKVGSSLLTTSNLPSPVTTIGGQTFQWSQGIVMNQNYVTGVALMLACLNVLFRDIEHLVAAMLLPWFFLTPVIWDPASQFKGHDRILSVLHYGNPVTPPIDAIRDPLWAGRVPHAADVIYLLVATVAALALGAFTFNRVDDRIAVEL